MDLDREIHFVWQKGPRELHTLAVGLGYGGTVVFTKGDDYYGIPGDPGRTVDESIVVRGADLRRLVLACDGTIDAEDAEPHATWAIVQTVGDKGQELGWASLDQIRQWLRAKGIGFEESRWMSVD